MLLTCLFPVAAGMRFVEQLTPIGIYVCWWGTPGLLETASVQHMGPTRCLA